MMIHQHKNLSGHLGRRFSVISTTIEVIFGHYGVGVDQTLWVSLEMRLFNISNIGFPRDKKVKIVSSRWAPTSYKWTDNPYKWHYKGVKILLIGVITPFTTGRAHSLDIETSLF